MVRIESAKEGEEHYLLGDNCLQDPFTDLKNLLGCPKILNNKNIFSFFKKSKQIGRKMKPP